MTLGNGGLFPCSLFLTFMCLFSCFVLFCFVSDFCLFLILLLDSAFTRTCPAVLACPRYPLNALYEKPSVYILTVRLSPRHPAVSCHFPRCDCVGGLKTLVLCSCFVFCFRLDLLFTVYCFLVAKGIYEGYICGYTEVEAIEMGWARVDGRTDGLIEMLWHGTNALGWDGMGCRKARKWEV